MSSERSAAGALLANVRDRVDAELEQLLGERRVELAALDRSAVALVDEIRRLLAAGGKRLRPALCLWAHRAAGGVDGPVVLRAAAALELLHTFALIHDDVMDRSELRRGVASSWAWFADAAPPATDPITYGTSVAILVGDLAAVLAEQTLRTCGAPPPPLALALDRFDRMRTEMAAGQLLDVRGAGAEPDRVAALKTSSYTAEGPVLIATALAEAGPAVDGPLRVYARLVGEAFQLRDAVLDGDAEPDAATRVNELIDRATQVLVGAPLDARGANGLAELAGLLRLEPPAVPAAAGG
ncbi:MAG TPA: polyprenyl synthetase family protein [Actinomycetota bacterium]|nr:polyprenyl synthetase family protein [Actinomycetota bacterium]